MDYTKEQLEKIQQVRLLIGDKKYVSHSIPFYSHEEICSQYSLGHSSSEIAVKFKVSADTILRLLKFYGIPVKKKTELKFYKENYSINREAFTDTSEEACAYFYGWLLTDGNISRSNRVSLEVNVKDVDILEKFTNYMNLSNSIFYRNRIDPRLKCPSNSGTIYFSDSVVAQNLRKLGLTESKSLSEECPDCFSTNRHFWRGCIEGDGHIQFKNNSYRVSLYGGKSLIESFQKYCQYLGVDSTISNNGSGMYICSVNSFDKVNKILSNLYDECTVTLDRKYKTYKEEYRGRHKCRGKIRKNTDCSTHDCGFSGQSILSFI